MPHTGHLLFILFVGFLTRNISLLLKDDPKSSILIGHHKRTIPTRSQRFPRQGSEFQAMSHLNGFLQSRSSKDRGLQVLAGPIEPTRHTGFGVFIPLQSFFLPDICATLFPHLRIRPLPHCGLT